MVSCKATEFDIFPAGAYQYAFGIDDDETRLYVGNQYDQLTWRKPEFPLRQVFTIKVIADWREKQCKLTFYFNGKKLNEEIEDCTMILLLYPCVIPYNKNAYCIIH